MPWVGYQEVYLARAFTRLGHEVRVITSDRVSPSARAFHPTHLDAGLSLDPGAGYGVLRLRSLVRARSMVVTRGLKSAIEEFDPDIVVAPGVGKLFAAPALVERRARRYKLVVLFSDNSDFWDFRSARLTVSSLRAKISQRVVKDAVYRRAVRFADRVCLQTPETQEIVGKSLSPPLQGVLDQKAILCPLGFDPDEFYFSAQERLEERDALGVGADDTVFVTCTRVNSKKSLERVVDAASALAQEGRRIRYVVAGFSEGTYGESLRAYINGQPDPSIFVCLPLLDHQEARRLYCASDVGVWLKAAISIQEAMGTGLPVLLESKLSVGHLVRDGSNGWLFAPNELADGMRRAQDGPIARPRERIASENAGRLSFDVIAQTLIDSVA